MLNEKENKTYNYKEELLRQINCYLDFAATYIDNLKIINFDDNGLPIYSRPKLDDKTILHFEEIPFFNSVQESLDSYFGNCGHNSFFKYDYEYLYKEPINKYIYRDYIKKIPFNGWEWPYTDFDDFNQLFVSEQEDYVYNKNVKKAFLNQLEYINIKNNCIPELYIIKKSTHPYIMFSFCLKYPREIYVFYMMKEPLFGIKEHLGKKFM